MDDAKRLLEIYDYYVKKTAITFEYDTPSLAEFQSRIERYPYSCELSIYLDHNVRQKGMGRMLYETLACQLEKMGIRNLYACIAYPEKVVLEYK